MTIDRRSFNGAMISVLAASIVPIDTARASQYPRRPVSIISPAPAGAGPDTIARVVADDLTKLWRQQVLIVNRPGAGTLISLQAAAAARPDGYTLFMPLSSTFIILPETQARLPLDLERDIVTIGLIGEQPMVIAVNPKLGVDTLSDLIALAKRRPDSILYGANPGGLPHMTGELLQQRAGIKLTLVPYPNAVKATQDAVAGVTQVAIESLAGLGGLIESGMLKPLAVAFAKRVPDFPNLPTVAEAAPEIETFESRGWFALTAPTGTPDAIVQKLGEDLHAVLSTADLQRRFAALGTYARPMTPAETVQFIKGEQALWRPIVSKLTAAPR